MYIYISIPHITTYSIHSHIKCSTGTFELIPSMFGPINGLLPSSRKYLEIPRIIHCGGDGCQVAHDIDMYVSNYDCRNLGVPSSAFWWLTDSLLDMGEKHISCKVYW